MARESACKTSHDAVNFPYARKVFGSARDDMFFQASPQKGCRWAKSEGCLYHEGMISEQSALLTQKMFLCKIFHFMRIRFSGLCPHLLQPPAARTGRDCRRKSRICLPGPALSAVLPMVPHVPEQSEEESTHAVHGIFLQCKGCRA